MFWALKKSGKKQCTGARNIGFLSPTDELYSLLVEADVVCYKSNVKQLYFSLYLGYVLLRYVLIYNPNVYFNFHLTFLQ